MSTTTSIATTPVATTTTAATAPEATTTTVTATATTTTVASEATSTNFCGRIATVLSNSQVSFWNWLVRLIGRSDLQYSKALLQRDMAVIQNADSSQEAVISAFKEVFNAKSDKTLSETEIKEAIKSAISFTSEEFRNQVYYQVHAKEAATFNALESDEERTAYLASFETPYSDNYGERTFQADPKKDVCIEAVMQVFADRASATPTATASTAV